MLVQSENATYHLTVVALNYGLNRHTEYVCQIHNKYTERKSILQLASVGLAQARPKLSTG